MASHMGLLSILIDLKYFVVAAFEYRCRAVILWQIVRTEWADQTRRKMQSNNGIFSKSST